MAKLTRKTAKIFGETASTTGADPAIGQFGSAKAGTYVGTGDIATIQSLSAWSNGWIDAVTPTHQFPTLPEMTGVHKVLSYQEAYLLQEGIPEYDSATTYYIDSLCKAKNSNNELVIYRSKVDNNTNHAVTNTSYWEEFLTNVANQDLSNLTNVGNNRLHALKSYSDEGELLADSEGYADVLKYAHSTFCGFQESSASPLNSSLFVRYGSLLITDEGIASDFSSSNFVTVANPIPTDISFDFSMQITVTDGYKSASSGNGIFAIVTGATALSLTAYSNGNYEAKVATDNNGTTETLTISTGVNGSLAFSNLVVGDKVTIHLGRDKATGKYYLSVQLNNNNAIVAELSNSNDLISMGTTILFGRNTLNSTVMNGTADLKYFNITSEGAVLFSGNRTGLDIIKSDDYTVVGTPTISTDGVISGTSTSNYVYTTKGLPASYTTFEIDLGTFKFTDFSSTEFLITNSAPISAGGFMMRTEIAGSSVFFKYWLGTSGNWDIASSVNCSINHASDLNKNIALKLTFDGSKYTLLSNVDNTGWQQEAQLASSTKIANSQMFYLGYGSASTHYSVDLNSFKIYVDGALIYQACLKIPFTWSKTGSKVVDVFYQDRVHDVYNQFGGALYYVIDEVNAQFALPQTELYGLIRRAGNDYSKPNFSSGVTISATPYTVGEGGWIYVNCEGFSNNASLVCKINNVQVGRFQVDASSPSATTLLIPVTVGDIFSVTTSNFQVATQVIYKFFKNQGV